MRKNLCNMRQVAALNKAGVPIPLAKVMTFEQARDALRELEALGWRPSPEWRGKHGAVIPALRFSGTNIIEATAPADRPREALSQLRDIGEWLANEGHSDLGAHADDIADSIARRYPESV